MKNFGEPKYRVTINVNLLDTGDGKKRESRETRLSAYLAEAKQHNSDTGKLGNRRMKPDNEAALPGLTKEADGHISTLSAFAVMAWWGATLGSGHCWNGLQWYAMFHFSTK